MKIKDFLRSFPAVFVILLCVFLMLPACHHDGPILPEPPEPEPPVDTVDTPDVEFGNSGTLPVLFIYTDNNDSILSKETYLHADWWIDASGIDGFESVGSAKSPLRMQIKGRGNSTWTNLEKKPYRLKFDEKHKILGMHSSRHWVLMAQAQYWMGQMNDALPFEIGRRMGMAWNPYMQPVEVVLNGDYIGLYFLTEKIRVAKNRVNVIEQMDEETDPYNITGGWLVEIENYVEPYCIAFTEGNGMPFWLTVHSPEVLSNEQLEYITRLFVEADSAIYVEDKSSREWERYIDMDSLAIYYIVQEVMDNPEAFSGSCFIHKQRGENTKLIFGPLWDCGSSFVRWNGAYEFNEFIYENIPSYCRCRWIAEIAKFPRFQECVRKHWQRFYTQIYPTLDEYMDDFTARIDSAGNADFKRWPQYSSNNTVERMNAFLKPSLHKKVEWLNSQWGN